MKKTIEFIQICLPFREGKSNIQKGYHFLRMPSGQDIRLLLNGAQLLYNRLILKSEGYQAEIPAVHRLAVIQLLTDMPEVKQVYRKVLAGMAAGQALGLTDEEIEKDSEFENNTSGADASG